MPVDYDIIIVGGGMVGASMACSLAASSYRIAVIEPFKPVSDHGPSFDERTVALTYSSKLIFNAINTWEGIATEAYPIKQIEVTNQNSFGFTNLGTQDSATEALGFVVPTRRIGVVLHELISKTGNIDMKCPAKVESILCDDDFNEVIIQADAQRSSLRAKLVILADGGRSGLLEQLGFNPTVKTYPQVALVGILGSDRAHHDKAFEHFTAAGPLALLPLRQKDYALAWTLPAEKAQSLSECSDPVFLNQLQQAFGDRAGKFISVANRNNYPLSYTVLPQPARGRSVVIGNAAHVVHPVAGQGFNLGLRDVGFLHEVLTKKHHCDPGDANGLSEYCKLRERETWRVGLFTDGLIRLFSNDSFPLRAGRNLGLAAINVMPGVKRALLKRTMGLNGRQSQLAMSGKYQ